MASAPRATDVKEFGDFQTPAALAEEVCRFLQFRGLRPASIVEPTCGVGNFLIASVRTFPTVDRVLGADVNPQYVATAAERLSRERPGASDRVMAGSFFDLDWPALLESFPDPLLVVGNPPWVTNSDLGALSSLNLPEKRNRQGHAGLDALTGKSNFDVSEWILTRLLECLDGRCATIAMLCKTAVARRVLAEAWSSGKRLESAEVRSIDAGEHFGAAVSACLLVCQLAPTARTWTCSVCNGLGEEARCESSFGWRDGQLIADVEAYEQTKHLLGPSSHRWRSGIKHDCARVMELVRDGDRYRNGLGETVELEDDFVYPLLKSSDLANGRAEAPHRHLLVTQRRVGDDTSRLRTVAPKAWSYLQLHADRLDRRASSIYRGRARFAMFGVGDYAFAPWKVAISGLYKKLAFVVVGSQAGRPIVLDDTACFVRCGSRDEAEYFARLLNSRDASDCLSAFIFWDAKRPVTVDILKRIGLPRLARQLGSEELLERFLAERDVRSAPTAGGMQQLGLFLTRL